MRPRPRRPGDDGTAQIEWATVIIVIASLMAILVVIIPGPISGPVREAVCTLLGGACDGGRDRADDPGPPPVEPVSYLPTFCEVNASSDSKGFTAKLIVKGGSETSFQRTEMSDGSVIIAANPSNKNLGLEVAPPGGKLKGGETANLGAGAELAGEWKGGRTVAWRFDKKNRAKADDLERQIVEEGKISSNPVVGLWNSLTKDDDDYDLPEPDMVIESNGGRVSVGGQAGIGMKIPGTSTDKLNKWDQKRKDKKDKKAAEKEAKRLAAGKEPKKKKKEKPPEEKEFDFGQGSGAGVEIEGGVQTRTGRDKLTARTTYASGAVNGNAEAMLGVGATGELKWQSQIRETRDEKGNLKSILLRGDYDKTGSFNLRLPFGVGRNGPRTGANSSLAAKRGSTLVDIPLNTPEERELGEKFLRENGGVSGAAGYFFDTRAADHGFATEDPGPDADPWDKLVFDKGKVWTTSHDRELSESEVGAEGKFIVAFGGSYTTSSEERRTEDARYLGPPKNGKREFTPYDSCVAR